MNDNLSLANEFAQKGSVLHFAIRLGYLPYDEAAAEKILSDVIKEGEDYKWKYDRLKEEVDYELRRRSVGEGSGVSS